MPSHTGRSSQAWRAGSPVTSIGSESTATHAFIEQSEPHRGKQFGQMMLVLMLPMMAVIGKASVVLVEALALQDVANRLDKTMDYTLFVSEGVRKLQLERGLTAMFLSGSRIDNELLYKLAAGRIQTDEFFDNQRLDTDLFLQGFDSNLNMKTFWDSMNALRSKVDERNMTLRKSIDFYTAATKALLNTALNLNEVPTYKSIWHAVVSFRAMSRAVDQVGIQRAIGSAVFSDCGSSRQTLLWFTTLEAEMNTFLNTSFLYYKQTKTWFDEGMTEIAPVPKFVANSKKTILGDPNFDTVDCTKGTETAAALSMQWFQSLTQFMGVLAGVGSSIVQVIKEELVKVKSSADNEVLIYACVTFMVTLVCIMLTIWYTSRMFQMTKNIHHFVLAAKAKTVAVNEEKKRTDQLLYQMMPRVVADRLRRDEDIPPQTFSEVTVYFSDIIDWSTISTQSTPLQIVGLLSDLYCLFDDVIEKYDVYKVETIADSYMCVSGLPEPNGSLHVQEVGEMSLEMLYAAQEFNISHIPGKALQLRIGFHSGSCVAAVVGTKMPRYCLFGDTVNTASRMETTGEALKIHVSEQANKLLEEAGGFVTEARGETVIKGKGAMKTYWLLSHERWQGKQIKFNN